MQEILINKLHKYILENNLDLVIALQEKDNVDSYLKEKVSSIDALLTQLLIEDVPGYIIAERCMDTLTQDLRPSKFNYLNSVLEEEFENNYSRLKRNGTLSYEVINLIELCNPVFETIGFTEDNENDRHLRYAITGAIEGYFEKQ
ncbi:MAG: DUF1896 domain-containing protein [Bacteroidota bacterium]|nr:DUF1896 domain-containing protein [Bacteroidota bacterium]